MSFLGKVKKKIKRTLSGGSSEQIKKGKNAVQTVESLKMTIGEIADRLSTPIPEEYAYLKNEMVSDVTLSYINAVKDCAVMTPTLYPEVMERNIAKVQEIGGKVIFADRKTYEKIDKSLLENITLPVILMDDGRQRVLEFIKPYRDAYKGTVVAITGSFGKTTTKFFIENVLKNKTFFSNKANNNSIHSIGDNIMKNMVPEYEYFVQEAGAVRVGTIETEGMFLRPDISVVTNVRPHHLAKYGTIENVFNDKMQIVKKLNEGGTAIVNFDDERIAAFDYECNVASFGIETDKPVKYRGKNIRQSLEALEMDIEYEEGTVHISAEIVGEYNAYNLLAAFAFGKIIGLSDEEIVKSVAHCKLGGTRQNLLRYGDNTFFIDCYNVANETIINSMDVLMKLQPENNGRRIAIVGAENSLGPERTQKTIELGKALSKAEVDEIICFGDTNETEAGLDRYGDARTLYNTLKECGFENTRLILSKKEMADFLINEVKKDDVVLFKCITYLDVTIPIDKAFGTNYCLSSTRVKRNIVSEKEKGFKGYKIWEMGESLITGSTGNLPEDLVIPDTFLGESVYGIDKRAFFEAKIKTLDLGNSVKCVLPGAFKNCSRLVSVKASDGLMHIMRGGFRGCEKLTEVTLGKGIRQIEVNAFDGCTSLRKIRIPKEAGVRIEKGAIPESVEVERI